MSSKEKVCLFCLENTDDDLQMGKLFISGEIVVHYYCLLFSSGLEQKGKRDEDGIVAFLPNDIHQEVQRGKRLTCSFCKRKGATVGCCGLRCRKVFHLSCGLKRDSLHQFEGSFRSYCSEHRPLQDIPYEELASTTHCSICFCKIDPFDVFSTLFPTCCRNGLFHRLCVQKQAISSGSYFFRCPLCNNAEGFQSEMRHYGIYIPEQDASWEREDGAYHELYVRPSSCDARICRCPKGREQNADDGVWQILLCTMCGSHGCHLKCGNISISSPQYECNDCKAIGKKVKKKSGVAATGIISSFDEETACESTKLSLPQFLGGRYGLGKGSTIYIDGSDDDSSDSEKRFCAEELPEVKVECKEEDEDDTIVVTSEETDSQMPKRNTSFVGKSGICGSASSSIPGLGSNSSEGRPSSSLPLDRRSHINALSESVFAISTQNVPKRPKAGPKSRMLRDKAQLSILNFFAKEDETRNLQRKMCVMTFRDNLKPSVSSTD